MLCQVNPVLNKDGLVSSEHYKLIFEVRLPPLGFIRYNIFTDNSYTTRCTIATLNTINYDVDNT